MQTMKNINLLSLIIAGVFFLGACSPTAVTTDEPGKAGLTANANAIPQGAQHVLCGCSSEIGSTCGNFVQLGSKYIPFDSKNGEGAQLGKMEWCGVDGAQAEVAGEIKDGKFVASLVTKIES